MISGLAFNRTSTRVVRESPWTRAWRRGRAWISARTQSLQAVDEAFRKLLVLVADVAALGIQREIEHGGGAFGVADAVRHLTLNGKRLEVGGGLVEDEGNVDAGQGHRNDAGGRGEIEEREAGAFTGEFAAGEVQDVVGRIGFAVRDAEHGSDLL